MYVHVRSSREFACVVNTCEISATLLRTDLGLSFKADEVTKQSHKKCPNIVQKGLDVEDLRSSIYLDYQN